MAPVSSHATARSLPPSTRLRWAFVLLVAGGVFAASVVTPPGDGVPTLGPFGLVGADKWLHAAAYAGVAASLSHALATRTRRAAVGGFLGGAAYGFFIELVQAFVPTRQFDLLDAAANALGAGVGVGMWVVAVAVLALVLGRD